MNTTLKRVLGIGLLLISVTMSIDAQYSSKRVKSKYQLYTDSLKAVEYNYIFPILGQQVYKKGFDIPYPAGVMANFMYMQQGIIIDNFQLGLLSDNHDIELTPVDFIEFGESTNSAYTVNFRPDLWIFPFLNVYGLFGYGSSTTEVTLTSPVQMTSVVEQGISTKGFGVMGAFGIGPVWASVDANWTWNKPDLLDRAVNVSVLGIRFGKTFEFKNNPERNIAIWAGGMRAKMSSETSGQIMLKDAIPQDAWDRKDEIVTEYNTWRDENYDDLTWGQKKAVDEVLDPIVDRIDNADGSSEIRYAMDKQVKQMWNGIIGAQFQYNKRWMFRTEAGIIGDRKSILASLNYRFKI